MKKSIFFAAAIAALTLAGCQKSESVTSNAEEAVSFDTYTGRTATKGTSMTADLMKASGADGFGVFAFYQPASNGSAVAYATNNAADFMNKQKVTWSTDKWVYSPVKYWPNNINDQLSFAAYHPYNANMADTPAALDWTPGSDKALLGTFNIQEVISKQQDFLFASALNQKKGTVAGKVSLTFKHMLSRIGFSVAAAVDQAGVGGTIDANTTITVTKLEVGYGETAQFLTGADLNLVTKTESQVTTLVPAETDPWTVNGTAAYRSYTLTEPQFKTQVSTGTDGQVVTSEYAQLNADDSYLMLFPATITNGINVRVTYEVKTLDSSNSANSSTITNVIEGKAVTETGKFVMGLGKAYTIKLLIGMTSVKFDVAVDDWGTVTETVVDVPANTAN